MSRAVRVGDPHQALAQRILLLYQKHPRGLTTCHCAGAVDQLGSDLLVRATSWWNEMSSVGRDVT